MLIEAAADGKRFGEMHVDGSVMAPVFTLPDAFLLGAASLPRGTTREGLRADEQQGGPGLSSRSEQGCGNRRTGGIHIRQGTDKVPALRDVCRRPDNGQFNLTFIDRDVPSPTSAGFETAYMRGLFQYGFEKARSGKLWVRTPPSDALDPARSKDEASGSRREGAIAVRAGLNMCRRGAEPRPLQRRSAADVVSASLVSCQACRSLSDRAS